jgi:hypothetical protein
MERAHALERLKQRYLQRGKEGKSRLLDEFCEHYGYERKYAIKLLSGKLLVQIRAIRPGPERRYEPVLEIVERVWQSAEQPCGKRLGPALALWLPHYTRHYGRLLPLQKKLLEEISPATLDRLLSQCKSRSLRGLSGTRPGTLLRRQIPIQGEVWDEKRPGFMEADSVAHCGSSLAGNFIWSLVYTCLASTWTEGRAVWNKGSHGVLEQTKDVEKSLPFAIRGFDFDNGSEWLNWTLIRYLQVRPRPIRLTRSRPYHKDDNAHVEQKNWMWPRQLLGYNRLENPACVELINALYKEAWGPLHNFFLPSMKLKAKRREGSRWIRIHDEPQTAYQRLLASQSLNARQRRRLRDWYESLDPFALARQVEARLQPILKRAGKSPLKSLIPPIELMGSRPQQGASLRLASRPAAHSTSL